jgi:hypothetical protein
MELSPATLRSYKASLRVTTEAVGEDATPAVVSQWLKANIPNPNSRRVFFSALLWSTKGTSAYDDYYKEFQVVKAEANLQTKKQELPDNRKDKYLTWDEVLQAYKKGEEEFKAGRLTLEDFTTLACYVLTPPVRADYAEMEIVKRMPKTPEKNYSVLRKTKPVFIFVDYKTAGTYGAVELPIPKNLAGLLGILGTTQNVVFKGNKNTLSHRIRNIFKQLTGKETGIGLLRHAYITKLYQSNPSIAEKEKVANQMLHSYTTGETYRELDEGDA